MAEMLLALAATPLSMALSRKSNYSYAMLNSLGDSFKRKKELNNIILEVNLLLYCEYHVAHFQN